MLWGLVSVVVAVPLVAAVAAPAGAQSSATLSISAPADAVEGDSGTTEKFFSISLSQAVSASTGVRVCVTGTATIDTTTAETIADAADYQPIASYLRAPATRLNVNCINDIINSGDTEPGVIVFGIRVKGDTEAESDETVIATLSFVDGQNPAGVTLGTSAVTYTILDDDTPTPVSVSPDWALTPSGVSAGESFRLLFVSSTTRDATATDIGTYNSFVQTAAKAGHSDISDGVGDGFKAVASTASVDARDNTATTGAGVPVYWLGGGKAADGYADFYDGSWDSYAARNESGATVGGTVRVWTGSNDDGTKHATDYLGNTNVLAGSVGTGSDPFTAVTLANSNGYRIYGLSPVFTVEAPPVISVSLPISEGESRTDAGEKKVPESEGGVGIGFSLAADQPLPTALTVCVRVTESGGDRVTMGDEGIHTVNMPASALNGSGTHTLTWTNTAADDRDSHVTVEVVAPNTGGCSAAAGSYTVSSSDGSDKLLIQDDEDTTVSLTGTDPIMTEGDATDTAVLTVSLDRRLHAGETIGVPIALTTGTGARLPGSTDSGTANHDFTVAAAAGSGHSGVTLANASTANPRVIFTGHDTNTVQTATVTFTPVANRDDPDTTHETITATLDSLGLLDTTVSGGVTAHATDNAATLTLEDDEAAPAACPAQNTVFSKTAFRILENGETTYCVRLLTAPSGGDTAVTIGRAGVNLNAANFSPATLTFTALNYETPQQVTVTGADEPNRHRNRPDMRLTHTASGGGYSSQNLGNVQVQVDDAPEVEVFAHVRYDDENAWRRFVNANGGMLRPSTITAAPGITPMRNVTPCCEVQYAVRLSNKPVGGAVTVDISVDDFGGTTASNITGISLTRNGTPAQSLSITFEERGPDPGCGRLTQQDGTYWDSGGWLRYGVSDSYDNNTDTSWECYRFVWVHNKREHQAPTRSLCADITHTATGGGVRKVTVDTIRMHSLGWHSGRLHYNPACPFLYANTLTPQNSPLPAQAAPVPTTAVAGLTVTDSGGTTATATWDAVPHADRYRVSYSAESQDGTTQTAGAFDDIAATGLAFDHGIAAPATVTVTVAPGYDSTDSDGTTVVYLDSLAATAALQTGQSSQQADSDADDDGTPHCTPALPDDAVTVAVITGWRDALTNAAGIKRFNRVLAALGVDTAEKPMPAELAHEVADWLQNSRWDRISRTLTALEAHQCQTDNTDNDGGADTDTDTGSDDPPPVPPEIAITAGADIAEGSDAEFTITAAPAPAADLDITVNITQTGAFVSTAARTVTIGTTGTATLTVATNDDSTDEPDGTITATVSTGTGYTVSSLNGAATVAVSDDDVPQISIAAGTDVTEGGDAVFTITADPKPHSDLSVDVTLTQTGDHGATTGSRTVTVPTSGVYTLTIATVDDSTDEPDGSVTATVDTGSGYTVSSSSTSATVNVSDDDVPEISVTAGADIAEGEDATFTITADPRPHSALSVTVEITQTGDHGAAVGTRTVTIPSTGSYTLTVATVGDSADEADGSVTATVSTGTGYTVSSSSSSATVTVSDNDDPPADDVPETSDTGTTDGAPAPSGPLILTVGDASAAEGDPRGLRFTAALSRPSDQEITLGYGAFDITAKYNQDFTVPYRMFTISPGETEVEIVVPIVDDDIAEDSETLRLYAYDSTFTAITGFAYATGTITDND